MQTKLIARLLVAWSVGVMPAQWHLAYAQGVVTETDAQAAERHVMERRAQRLAEGWGRGEVPARAPNLSTDTTPVRTPRTVADPHDSALAERAAERYAPRPITEVVGNAQRGQDMAIQSYQAMDISNYAVHTDRGDPGETDTSADGRVNVSNDLPGFNLRDMQLLEQQGQAIYDDPALLKRLSQQNQRNMQRKGCRETRFVRLDAQNVAAAAGGARNRILRVEFFDVERRPIPHTQPQQYELIRTPSVYKGGAVKLDYQTIGGAASQWWDYVDEARAIRYTYTPYSAPLNANYFTYNTRLAFDYGSGPVEQANAIASYGDPKDGWTPAIAVGVPLGAHAVYVSSDLYRTDVNFFEPNPPEAACPPDPPAVCEVSAAGGGVVRWCPGSPGANIVQMYDDLRNPSQQRIGKQFGDLAIANSQKKDYTNDATVVSGVVKGLNAPSGAKAAQLAGVCRRESVSRIELIKSGGYGIEDVNSCTETLINPYPNGCKPMTRSFGLASMGEHAFLTVRAYEKKKVPIIDPQTGQTVGHTFQKEPVNITGSVLTDFAIMGAPQCPRDKNGDGKDDCAAEPDEEGIYFEYHHTPFGGAPKEYVVDGIRVQAGGTGSFSDYGAPPDGWLPTGTAVADGTLHEIRLLAKLHMVTVNTFSGCERYLEYVADGFCKGAKLTCTDTAPTRTIGGVTFGPGLPNRGIVDVLKPWGTDGGTTNPDYSDGEDTSPVKNPNGELLLEDRMCWSADAEPFTTCQGADVSPSMRVFNKGEEIWATDCNIETAPDGAPLESSGMCTRQPSYDSCDERFEGLYTGVCYLKSVAYDCGEQKSVDLPIVVEESGDVCSGAMRCLGTECHRPNLAGYHLGDFAQAAGSLEALNMMKFDMVCAETGKRPTSVDQPCTPTVFGGNPYYCKVPVGSGIGITPNCCRETQDAVKGEGPDWIAYLKVAYLTNKIMNNQAVQSHLGQFELYNSVSRLFGDVSDAVTAPFKDVLDKGAALVSDVFVEPFSAGFDKFFGSFGSGAAAGAAPAQIGVDAATKSDAVGGLSFADNLQQQLYKSVYEILDGAGLKDLADALFVQSAEGMALTETAQTLVVAFQIYGWLRLIGHIVFACKKEEYEWAMNNKQRLCTYAGSCCSKRSLGVCLERRSLYCCYKSIAARVISERILKQGLVASRNGFERRRCSVKCSGFTPAELAMVDWSRVDLTEWIDALVESGLYNKVDPATNYGIAGNTIDLVHTMSRGRDEEGRYDQRAPAEKTVEGLSQNLPKIGVMTEALRRVPEHCYGDDDRKMPYAAVRGGAGDGSCEQLYEGQY